MSKYEIAVNNPLAAVYDKIAEDRMRVDKLDLAMHELDHKVAVCITELQNFMKEVATKHNALSDACKQMDEYMRGTADVVSKILSMQERTIKHMGDLEHEIEILKQDGEDTDHELKYLRSRADINMHEIYRIKDELELVKKPQ